MTTRPSHAPEAPPAEPGALIAPVEVPLVLRSPAKPLERDGLAPATAHPTRTCAALPPAPTASGTGEALRWCAPADLACEPADRARRRVRRMRELATVGAGGRVGGRRLPGGGAWHLPARVVRAPQDRA